MLFRSFCQHNLQYCDCLVAAYVFRMPVFLPIVHSNAFIQRRLAFKNLFFLFYRLLCVVFTLIWARIAALFANKATPKTLNRVTGVILVVLGIAVMCFNLLA